MTEASKRPRGYFTIRTAAVLFGLSAILELATLTSRVAWFGAMRDGWPIVLYHLYNVALLAVVGAGLWIGRRWGALMLYAATALYSLDQIRYLLDVTGRQAEILYQLRDFSDAVDILGLPYLTLVSTVMTATFVAGWWGFAAYVHLRREYFR